MIWKSVPSQLARENKKFIYKIVYQCVQRNANEGQAGEKEVTVWREGHLPIRRIVVGPSPNQSNLKEWIQHYCLHMYWLNDVDMTMSRILYANCFERARGSAISTGGENTP